MKDMKKLFALDSPGHLAGAVGLGPCRGDTKQTIFLLPLLLSRDRVRRPFARYRYGVSLG